MAALVVDGETGEPLPFAHVRLGAASASAATAVADADGRFSVRALPPGPYRLTASFVGYEPHGARLTIGPGATVRERIGLRPTVASGGTVVVDGLQPQFASAALGADLALHPLAPALAGGAPAPTSTVDGATLRPLLGVAERTFRDGLSLQGGEAGEHVLQIDGATVYEPLAIGPVLGALSPLAVGRVTVQKAGFGARHGSHLAGVLQTEHALARPVALAEDGAAAFVVSAEADAFAASGRLRQHARVGAWRGVPVEATSMVVARRSLWDVLPALGVSRLGTFALDRPEDDRLPPRLALDVGIAVAHTVAGARRTRGRRRQRVRPARCARLVAAP